MQRMTDREPRLFVDLLDEDRIVDPIWARQPLVEKVSDRLADLLFGIDDILKFLSDYGATSLRWMEPEVSQLFDHVDALMRRITD